MTDDKTSWFQMVTTPTPQNGAISGAVGVGMVRAQDVVEDVNTILGFTPSEWTTFAAIAAFAYTLVCLWIALPKAYDTAMDWYNRWIR